MTTIQFLAGWAIRSSILILSGAVLLRTLRVKDASVRLAAWTAMLCGSLAIPALTAALPRVPVAPAWLAMPRVAARPAEVPVAILDVAPGPVRAVEVEGQGTVALKRFDWTRGALETALTIYVLAAVGLLLRLGVGLAMGLRLLRGSRATGKTTEGIEIRESDRVSAPVTLGIARPAIVLPCDWSHWDRAKLDAVLAHERSHVRRRDPLVQALSAIHRALLWHSPLSWFLHQRIVRVAEEASDDAAVMAMRDPASYAEVLLDFMQRGVRSASWPAAGWSGVPMARYGRQDERIDRILDGRILDRAALSRGVTRGSLAAILALGSPLAYVVAAAHPQSAAQVRTSTAVPGNPAGIPARPAPLNPSPQMVAQNKAPSAAAPSTEPVPAYLNALGTVSAINTVSIRARVDGQLLSVGFNEGDLVQKGQLLASIDPRPYQVQLTQAEAQLVRDQGQLAEASMAVDRANIDSAKLQLAYTQILSPITGVAGLRLVDPGNIVHAADGTSIVTITQLQPIAVVFNLPEDRLPEVLARLRESANLPVEVWSGENAKIADGRLTAVDNQIDAATGTAKFKAVFDNQDGALYPNQFVNVRLLVNTH